MLAFQTDPSRNEELADRSLALSNMPAEQIRAIRPRGVAPLFPDHGGQAAQWTIAAVLQIDRQAPLYRSWRSGMPDTATTLTADGYSGSTANSLETM